MTIQRILHASDFSRASRPALTLAQELAKAFKAELILFHAYQRPPSMVIRGSIPRTLFKKMLAEVRGVAWWKLEQLAKSARRRRVRVSTLLMEGPPAVCILRAADWKRASLIVLGTRGRTGVARMLLGSVAERVVRSARCPVLTVRVHKP